MKDYRSREQEPNHAACDPCVRIQLDPERCAVERQMHMQISRTATQNSVLETVVTYSVKSDVVSSQRRGAQHVQHHRGLHCPRLHRPHE